MFIGYAKNDHATGTHHMLNLETKKVWKTHDVKCLASDIAQYEAQMKREHGGNVTVYGDNNDDDNSNGIVQNINNNVDQDINNNANEDNQNEHEDDDKDDKNDNKEDHDNDNDDNNNDDEADGDNSDNDPPANEPINPHALHEMK